MNEFVLNGLVKRRAELAGDIETHEALRKLDFESLDDTILKFDPAIAWRASRPSSFRPPKDWSNRARRSILRQAAEPLTTRDIVLQLLVERTG
jgi:hypothetical protein